jgi:hypothetical protein
MYRCNDSDYAEFPLHESSSQANARPEWRGAKDVEMQTERAIPRPLQAAR